MARVNNVGCAMELPTQTNKEVAFANSSAGLFLVYKYVVNMFILRANIKVVQMYFVYNTACNHFAEFHFQRLSESRFLLWDLQKRSKFANFSHDLMQNQLE